MLLTYETVEQSLVIIPLALFTFVPFYFNFWHYPTLTYYARFVNLTSGKISKSEYLDSFGSHIQRDHKIASFLKNSTNKDEHVFVWGDSSIIYALSQRFPPLKYVADYHIRDFSSDKEVVSALQKKPPSYIAVLPNTNGFRELDYFIQTNYGLVNVIEKAKIWKLLSPKIRGLPE